MPTSPSAPRAVSQRQRPEEQPAGAVPAPPIGAGAAGAGAALGGAVGSLAATPALVPIAGAAVTAEAVKEALDAFFPRLRRQQQRWLGQRVAGGAVPGATQEDILEALAMENELQGEFERRVRERVLRDLGPVLKVEDAGQQKVGLTKLFERERRYAEQRAVEMGRRLEKTVERVAVRRDSKRGAYWDLGEAKDHTPECVAMAGKFWSWEAIDNVFRPPVGPGCKCSLKTEKAAIVQGLLMPGQTPHGRAAAERVRVVHGNHHGGGLPGLREAIIRTGLADEDTADAALIRWALEAA